MPHDNHLFTKETPSPNKTIDVFLCPDCGGYTPIVEDEDICKKVEMTVGEFLHQNAGALCICGGGED